MYSETPTLNLCDKEELASCISSLKKLQTFEDRERFLDGLPLVKSFFPSLEKATLEERYLLKSLVVAGQGGKVFSTPLDGNSLKILCEQLREIENFYAPVGGIIGYQRLVLEQLGEKKSRAIFHPPNSIPICSPNAAVDIGLGNLSDLGEIYPIGGAAERLQLKDNNRELPAAKLQFLSSNLLEGLIRDLQAREYLYFKKYGEQLITPVALMTSNVKEGHAQIVEILEANNWFGRTKERFKLFSQPLVPAFDALGFWELESPGKLALKPGGHGVLWKLMEQEGVFDWFASFGRSKALIRQINNPISGTDYGLLSFIGTGFLQDKKFGFAACPPACHAKEGRIVVREEGGKKSLTNIEYCTFAKNGISETSSFPANANILFVDLEYVREVAKKYPFPGLIANFKNGVARLETTMQNIADQIPVEKSYLTLHHRRKTLSATKREYKEGKGLLETPLGALYDYLKNCEELLKESCGMELPPLGDEKTFLEKGPNFFFQYHPALGPLFCDIAKKIRGGKLSLGADLQLEISDLLLVNLTLRGSLRIQTEFVTGHRDENGNHCFSHLTGKCEMHNVQVENNPDEEGLSIVLGLNSRFVARDTIIKGSHQITVPDNCTLYY